MNDYVDEVAYAIKKIAKYNGFVEIFKTSYEEANRTVYIPSMLKAVHYIAKDMDVAYTATDKTYDYTIKYRGMFILYEVKEQMDKKGYKVFQSNYFLQCVNRKLTKKLAIYFARKKFAGIFDPKDKVLHIPIGCAGSGKSTLSKSMPNASVISPDIYRIEMLDSLNTGIYYDTKIEPEVWKRAYADLERVMRDGVEIFFDATNLTVGRRLILIELAEKYRYRTKFHIMETTLAECIIRNSKRKKRVPVNMIIRQFKSRELPIESEYLKGELDVED